MLRFAPSLRILRQSAAAKSSAASLLRASRFYASESTAPVAAAGKLLLNFAVPHQSILKDFEAIQVNISSTEGDMGILADHVPTISQLNPGVIEIVAADKTRKFFVSGGFATINPNSSLDINCVEAFAIEDLDAEAARKGAEEATRKLNASGATDADRAAARVELEVFEAAAAAAAQK